MRKLKYHERKLLKKVDFLQVRRCSVPYWVSAGPLAPAAACVRADPLRACGLRRRHTCGRLQAVASTGGLSNPRGVDHTPVPACAARASPPQFFRR
jgi:hypothetical protein